MATLKELELARRAYEGVMRGLQRGDWSQAVAHPAIPSDIRNPENPRATAIRAVNAAFDRYLVEIGSTPTAISNRVTA